MLGGICPLPVPSGPDQKVSLSLSIFLLFQQRNNKWSVGRRRDGEKGNFLSEEDKIEFGS